jgi:hypothetical protein
MGLMFEGCTRRALDLSQRQDRQLKDSGSPATTPEQRRTTRTAAPQQQQQHHPNTTAPATMPRHVSRTVAPAARAREAAERFAPGQYVEYHSETLWMRCTGPGVSQSIVTMSGCTGFTAKRLPGSALEGRTVEGGDSLERDRHIDR